MRMDASTSQSDGRRNNTLSPLPTQRRQLPVKTIAVLLAALAVWGLAHLYTYIQNVRWDQRAPVVVGVRSFNCSLSPDRSFIAARADTLTEGVDFFEAPGGRHIVVPPPAAFAGQPARGTWLSDGRYFNYTRWSVRDRSLNYAALSNEVPENGWVVDVANRSAVDIAELSVEEREQVLRDAGEQLRSYEERVAAGLTSPSGAYQFRSGAIWTTTGEKVAEARDSEIARPCAFGWKADSSGFYFVEMLRPPTTSTAGAIPGPVRLLTLPSDR